MKKKLIFITRFLSFVRDLKSQGRSTKIPVKTIISSVKESNSLMHWALNVAQGARQYVLNIYK